MADRQYIAIDLKSFYASVECVARGLDPLTTNLVVADASRTEKTICLAVSPSLKAYGIGGRARLFEVVQRVREVNYERRRRAGWWRRAPRRSRELAAWTGGRSTEQSPVRSSQRERRRRERRRSVRPRRPRSAYGRTHPTHPAKVLARLPFLPPARAGAARNA